MKTYAYEIYNIYDKIRIKKYPVVLEYGDYIYYDVENDMPLQYYAKEDIDRIADIYIMPFGSLISESHRNKSGCLKDMIVISSNEEVIKELIGYLKKGLKKYISTSEFMEDHKKELRENYEYYKSKMVETEKEYKKFYGDFRLGVEE